jgi:hypothetical protein
VKAIPGSAARQWKASTASGTQSATARQARASAAPPGGGGADGGADGSVGSLSDAKRMRGRGAG